MCTPRQIPVVTRTGPLPPSLSDTWKYALVGGLISVPLTTVGYWQSGSELSLSPVLLGGLLAGYLARRATGTADGVGVRAGVVGALPTLWILADVLGAASALSGPTWFMAVGVGFTGAILLVVAVVGFGLGALAGALGARAGSWLAGRTGRRGPPAAGS